MPYNPGIQYQGGQLLAQGLAGFGAGIGAGLQARQNKLDELKKKNAAAKGLRTAFQNLGLLEKEELEDMSFEALTAFGSQASNMIGTPMREQQLQSAKLSNKQAEREVAQGEAADATAAEITQVEAAKNPQLRVVAENASNLSAEDQFAFMDRLQQQGYRSRTAIAQAVKAEADAETAVAELKAIQDKAVIGLTGDKEKVSLDLGKEIRSSPEIREFMKAKGLLSGLRANVAEATERKGPLDISLIFSFMKTLDPGSTVREGEYATAAEATGVPERIINAYNKAVDGSFLGPEQLSQFVLAAEKAVEGSAETANEVRRRVIAQGNAVGIEEKFFAGEEFSVYPTFATEEEALAAGLTNGTEIVVGGKRFKYEE